MSKLRSISIFIFFFKYELNPNYEINNVKYMTFKIVFT